MAIDHMNMNTELHAVVEAVMKSRKYAGMMPALVSRIAATELRKQASPKKVIKATRNKLHQVGGAYWDSPVKYDRWLKQFSDRGPGLDRDVCKEMMGLHASTRERLPIVEDFYSRIFAMMPPVHSILDLACGLNPLAIPWIPMANGTDYFACDIYTDLVAFLNRFFATAQVQGKATLCDLVTAPPGHKVDVAFLLKALPCLEQIDKNISLPLLEGIKAQFLIVSFPARSLGGRDKGMVPKYAEGFLELISEKKWAVERLEFATELAFVVEKA